MLYPNDRLRPLRRFAATNRPVSLVAPRNLRRLATARGKCQ
jgi:hypothetical protein